MPHAEHFTRIKRNWSHTTTQLMQNNSFNSLITIKVVVKTEFFFFFNFKAFYALR